MLEEKMQIAEAIAQALGIDAVDAASVMEYPPNPELGDLAVPCFRFAKTLRKSPQEIAKQAAERLDALPTVERAAVVGGYLNVFLNRTLLAAKVAATARTETASLFSRKRGSGRRAAIDFSSPNIAKPFGVGHLRSTMIGQAIGRLMEADGYEVVGINHLGDWGTQFGKNMAAYVKWGDEHAVKADPVRELFKLYVKFHVEAEKDPALDDEARAWFKRLEDGDPEAVRLWKWFIAESRKVFEETYQRLGVTFQHQLGESFYNDKMDAVVEELQLKGLLVDSDGAEVVDLSNDNMPPCIIRKSDGATIYATRDLAAALYRHDVLGADILVYVVGAEQTLHFAQVFRVLSLMGRDWAANCHHIAFGMMKYNGERLSTRRGKVVYLEDVLQRAVDEARQIIEEKNPTLADKAATAEAVGIGAVVFNDLKNDRMHDVDFRFEDVLNFDGETGPYVQYTHARACSVLRKATEQGLEIGAVQHALQDPEWRLIGLLAQSNEILERAVDQFDPSVLARHALDICHAFNRFYHDCPILTAAEPLRQGRLALTEAVRNVIAYTLFLLGLQSPEAM